MKFVLFAVLTLSTVVLLQEKHESRHRLCSNNLLGVVLFRNTPKGPPGFDLETTQFPSVEGHKRFTISSDLASRQVLSYCVFSILLAMYVKQTLEGLDQLELADQHVFFYLLKWPI